MISFETATGVDLVPVDAADSGSAWTPSTDAAGSASRPETDANPVTPVPRVGRRTLLAKTCPECRCLLTADRFVRTAKGYYATRCYRCVQRRWLSNMDSGGRDRVYSNRNGRSQDQNRSTRITARRHGAQWTGPELELVARRDLSAPQVAEMLGRSLFAVRQQRYLLRKSDPKKTWLVGGTK